MDFHNSNLESPPPKQTLSMIEESEREKSLLDISNSIKMSPEYEKEDATVETDGELETGELETVLPELII